MNATFQENRGGKRRRVLLVATVTTGVLVGLWFGLISAQQKDLEILAGNIDAAQRRLETTRKTLELAPQLEDELAAASAMLARSEEGMASGDFYSWVINQIRQFKLAYRVDIPQFSTILGPADTTLLPKFPYKQVTLSIGGTGYYHDIGQFVAAYENQFPYSRIQNLELEPAPALAGAEKEKLTFRMDIVTLVKPGS